SSSSVRRITPWRTASRRAARLVAAAPGRSSPPAVFRRSAAAASTSMRRGASHRIDLSSKAAAASLCGSVTTPPTPTDASTTAVAGELAPGIAFSPDDERAIGWPALPTSLGRGAARRGLPGERPLPQRDRLGQGAPDLLL